MFLYVMYVIQPLRTDLIVTSMSMETILQQTGGESRSMNSDNLLLFINQQRPSDTNKLLVSHKSAPMA